MWRGRRKKALCFLAQSSPGSCPSKGWRRGVAGEALQGDSVGFAFQFWHWGQGEEVPEMRDHRRGEVDLKMMMMLSTHSCDDEIEHAVSYWKHGVR